MRRLYLPLLLLLLYSQGWAVSSPIPKKLHVIRIDATLLSPLAIGLEVGRQSKALFPDIEYRYDAHLAAILNASAFDEILHKRLPSLLKQLDPAYQEEMKGVASVWSISSASKLGDGQLSLEEYQILNLLPDLGLPTNGAGLGIFSKASAEESPIAGRNLDWSSTPELRSLQAITVYQYAEQSWVNIGFAGVLSVMSGFNQQGLFLAGINADPFSPYEYSLPLPDNLNTSGFDLRKVLETRSSIQAAVRFLAGKTYGFSSSTLIADKKSAKVLEYTTDSNAELRTWDSSVRTSKPWGRPQQIAVVGCLVLPDMPDNCKDANDAVRWQRLHELMQFNPTQPAKVADVSSILFDTANRRYEIFNSQTLQSMIYLPENNHLYLYTAPVEGGHPAIPTHQAYLDLLAETDAGGIDIVWLIWLLLLAMLGGIIWVRRQALPQQHKL
ncbi:C45 family autoproteolytic acyltransferase/hydolase [Thiothrix lacustris]|uniref:C45 family autoproteolytic acyltransferase/hydolase n=1 Tax=Thiothrix lacustris TaxID=525917 RepID=UPI0027E3EBC1|nr:C45 family autoproteolytic acyltransferase/hydolase [Thiothrix lacustris]WMP19411.1 C45 family autoproteolytic acyltransferase/hydrolase [Thiothrix lacustris]